VIAVRSGANAATLLIESSILNKSKTGNGLRLEGGVAATVRRTSIDRNGRQLTDPVPTINGRGVEAFDDSQLTLEHSSVSQNYDGGLLIVQTSSAIIRNSTISLNGINGIFFLGSPSAEIHGNFILGNGTKGARGAATGYNGIEVADGWTGPQMLIHENSIFDSTAGGIYIGGSAVNVNVADNHFYNNFLGVTIANPANVTLQGNLFELPAVQGAEEGILIVGPGPVVTVGGAGPNTFTNYLNAGGASPAIHCGGSVTVSCPAGGNVWQNVDLRVLDCPATCSSAP
jgi:parallel beta-helix repeat protein